MIINNKKTVNHIVLLIAIITCCFSCETDLYETFEDYSKTDVVSIGSPDSLKVQSGFEKLLFRVYINADPKIKKGIITWNFGENEKTFNIDRTIYQNEVIEVEIDIEEGSYEFSVHMEDSNGNKSNKTSVFTEVLGDTYRNTLLNRTYTGINLDPNSSEAIISWTSNRYMDTNSVEQIKDELLVQTELTYTSSLDNSQKSIFIDEAENNTVISDYLSEGSFSFKTTYRASVDSQYVFVTNSKDGVFPTIP